MTLRRYLLLNNSSPPPGPLQRGRWSVSPFGGSQGEETQCTNMEKASKHNNYHYDKNLKDKANYLRNNGTKAEVCLWKYVLKANLPGYSFKRQRPVLNYIADFMSEELMLIIEVDGITHTYEESVPCDQDRQAVLEEVGFTVLRFTDDEVLEDINSVRDTIVDWIERQKNLPPPGPLLGVMVLT
jgi:very-short-patch-repair endonuclease